METSTRDPLPGVPVVVTGLMGAGKTTVASRLAGRWDRVLRDSDADLQTTTGRTASELAGEHGADHLHDLEARHLLDAVAASPATVVAAAASTVERPECREALAGPPVVVWLDAPPQDLVARQHLGSHRPRYGADLLEMLQGMDARRRPLFEQVADVVVRLHPPQGEQTPDERTASIEALVDEVEHRVVQAAGARDGEDVR